ncbi:MAG: DUF1559 domain-containing protein [Planctomycetes bacterium]|nr:DUF1559 domain-containing protein [Planctomycetota bacterium]
MNMRRTAFTLVELLVVIAIIGILIALLLPAVQTAREAARRSQCTNNLKQVGLALHAYHAVHGTFPPAASWDGSTNLTTGVNAISGFANLLPYYEQGAMYAQWNFSVNQAHVTNREPNKFMVPILFCPTRRGPTLVPAGNAAAGDYALCTGTSPANDYTTAEKKGIFNQNTNVRLQDIRDGSSQTLAVGEKRVKGQGTTNIDGPQFRWGFWSSRNTISPMNRPTFGAWGDPDANFGSDHPSGAHFVFADGSVRFMLQVIDLLSYQRLSNKSDGVPVALPE